MPDYEIRFFHADGSLALVHMCHHDCDDDALAHARAIQGGNARFELRQGVRDVAGAR